MSEERRQILNMLAEGKISADEAERLLDAVGEKKATPETPKNEAGTEARPEPDSDRKPKNLRVVVKGKKGKGENVNIRVPLQLFRAGVKLGSFMPFDVSEKVNAKLKDKGIDIDVKNINSEKLDQIFESLQAMSIDIDEDDESVKIFCE